jgi:hypothetical protein
VENVEIKLNFTATLVKERSQLAAADPNIRKKPIAIDVTLTFTVGSDKGIIEVSANSGQDSLGKPTLMYHAATSDWTNAA